MLPVAATEAPPRQIKHVITIIMIMIDSLAAAELVAVRVTLGGPGVVRERELGAAPPVLPPQPHPVPHLTIIIINK